MNTKFSEVVIVAAARTPIGTYKGSLKNIKADQLGSIVIKEVINRTNINYEDINEVIMGQVLTAGAGQNPARQASINAGICCLITSLDRLLFKESSLFIQRESMFNLFPISSCNSSAMRLRSLS